MKINYNNKMEEILASLKEQNIRPKLLLHTCCAPCSSAVIERLASYFEITVLYYNPNIEPKEEYEKRKEEQKRFLKLISKNIKLMDCDYDNEKFKFRKGKGRGQALL